MGSTDSIPQNNSLRLNLDNWEYVLHSQPPEQQMGQQMCARLKNKMTGEELDQYDLYIRNNDQRTQYEQMLAFRNQNEILVPVSHINQENLRKLCSLVYHLKVYIEPIPLRISNIKDVQFPENLYLLSRTLKGFKILYDKVGKFHITEDLVCINEEGIVKVWLNHNLSLNEPQKTNEESDLRYIRSRIPHEEQNLMSWEIISMIDQITSRESIPGGYTFVQFLKNNRYSMLNLSKAHELVFQYSSEMKSQIPQIFESVVKTIRQNKGIFDSEADINQNIILSKSQQLQAAIRNRRFKQSQVQRVGDFRNGSNKSYVVSEQNNTFTDKLKKYDVNFNKHRVTAFGESSGENRTPTRDSLIFSLPKKQLNTDRQNVNVLNLSEISNQPAGSQSHNILSTLANQHGVVQISSGTNSQVLSTSKSKSLLHQIKQADSPQRQPQTYFSQYLQLIQEQDLTMKQRQFSFGRVEYNLPIQSPNGLLRNAPLTHSRMNTARNQDGCGRQRPVVTFTYSNSLNPSLHQSLASSNDQVENNLTSNNCPISPPTVQNPSLIRIISPEFKKKKEKIFNQEEKSQKHQPQIQDIEELKQNQNLTESQEESTEPFQKLRSEQQDSSRKEKKKNIVEDVQEIEEVFQRLQASKSDVNEEHKQQTDEELDEGNSLRRRVASQQLNISKNIELLHPPIKSEANLPEQLEPTISNKKSSKQSIKNSLSQSQQVSDLMFGNELDLDPDILADLVKFKKREKEKQKLSNSQNTNQ